MACFFINYDHETDKVFDGINSWNFSQWDEIYIFYNKSVREIPDKIRRMLDKIEAKVHLLENRNPEMFSTDYVLAAHLFIALGFDSLTAYYIVSNDESYDCICTFVAQRDVFIRHITHMGEYNQNEFPQSLSN